jgi:hypothetical protein
MSLDISSYTKSLALLSSRQEASIRIHKIKLIKDLHTLEQTTIRYLDELLNKYSMLVKQNHTAIFSKQARLKQDYADKVRSADTIYSIKKFGFHVAQGKHTILQLHLILLLITYRN